MPISVIRSQVKENKYNIKDIKSILDLVESKMSVLNMRFSFSYNLVNTTNIKCYRWSISLLSSSMDKVKFIELDIDYYNSLSSGEMFIRVTPHGVNPKYKPLFNLFLKDLRYNSESKTKSVDKSFIYLEHEFEKLITRLLNNIKLPQDL